MVDHGMMRAYSEDLRQKVVQALEQHGTSKSEAARLFGISLSSVKRYTRLASRGEPLTPRKGGGRPPERDEWRRAAWKVTVSGALDARSLVFVDEMGTNTSLSPLYGWSKKGQRVHGSVPRNRGKNTTLLSSMTIEGMGPSLAVEGASTARVFETYVERVLAPRLREGQVVVMDNLSAHKGER